MKYTENLQTELKREVNADLKKEVIAFANTDGGEIYIGIDNDGNVVGVEDTDFVMSQIGNMIRDGIKPDLTTYTSIETIDEDGVKVVKVSVMRGTKRPYHLTEKGLKPSGVFIRHGVSSVPVTDEAIRQMLRESDGVSFDKSRCINQELTFEYAAQFFANRGLTFNESNKRSLVLIDSDGYYTNAALLLSDKCEHSIKCAVYNGVGKTNFQARKEFFGSILKQLDDAYDYINLNNKQNSTFDGLRRVDNPDYPNEAIREALLNCITHRDYDYSGSTIINIYDDRMEFISLGGLIKGITVTDIMNGISQPRNSIIANVFYRLELIESYGTGIQKIMESYKTSNVKPTIGTASASFVVTLPKMGYTGNGHNGDKEERLLHFIENNHPVTRKNVEEFLKIPKHLAVKVLNSLLEDGKIIKDGNAKAVRYYPKTVDKV